MDGNLSVEQKLHLVREFVHQHVERNELTSELKMLLGHDLIITRNVNEARRYMTNAERLTKIVEKILALRK